MGHAWRFLGHSLVYNVSSLIVNGSKESLSWRLVWRGRILRIYHECEDIYCKFGVD